MRKAILVTLFGVGVVVGVFLHSQLGATAHALQAGCAVPKSYGAFRSFAGIMVFEAPDGTLRIMDANSCTIDRTVTRK